MLVTREQKPANTQNNQHQITNKFLFEKYIQLIQSYIKDGIENPFIILTLLCQSQKHLLSPRHPSFLWSMTLNVQWYSQLRKLPCNLPSLSKQKASFTEEENTTLRSFFSEIKFIKQITPENELVSLLGIFFLYFPQYMSLMPEQVGKKIHSMVISVLQKTYPIKTSALELFNRCVSDEAFSINTLQPIIVLLKKEASIFTDQEWLEIFDQINKIINLTYYEKEGIAMLAQLAEDIPAPFQKNIIQQLFNYLTDKNTDVSKAAVFALEKFSYVVSKEERTRWFNCILNNTDKLEAMQIKLLGKLINVLNQDECLLAIKLLLEKTSSKIGRVRIEALKSLENLPLAIKKIHHDAIIRAFLSAVLKDNKLAIQQKALRSLANIASISSNEKRKFIIIYLYAYFIQRNNRSETYKPLIFSPIISNEKIEIAFKILLEKQNFYFLEQNFLAIFFYERFDDLINRLCRFIQDGKKHYITVVEILKSLIPLIKNDQTAITSILDSMLSALNKENNLKFYILDNHLMNDLIPLIPIFSIEQNTLLLTCLYKKLSEKELNHLYDDLKNWEDKEKISFSKIFKVLFPLFSSDLKITASLRIREMLIDENIQVRKKAVISLYTLTSYSVDIRFTDMIENVCQLIPEIDISKRHLAIEIVDRFIPHLSNTQYVFVIQTLRNLFLIKNEDKAIIQAAQTLNKLISSRPEKNWQEFIFYIKSDLCAALLSIKQSEIHNQIVIALGYLASFFSRDQQKNIIDFLFKHISDKKLEPCEINDINTTLTQLLIHLSPIEKANLYVRLMTLQSVEIKREFAPLINQLYTSLYELPQVMPSREINNIIESYLGHRNI